MNNPLNIAVVGATGAVGQVLLDLLEKRRFPINSLRLYTSARSAGSILRFCSEPIQVEALTETSFRGVDLAFFATGGDVARRFAPIAVGHGAIVIDKSSAFRLDPQVPLVIPEINAHALQTHQGIISNPNCTATIMLMAIAPLHRKNRIRRIVAATYQAASGAGADAVRELREESQAILGGLPYQRSIFSQQYAFNVFPHDSQLYENGYVDEELKILEESRKILEHPDLQISATCVRVPTLRSHAEALNIEFSEPFSVEDAYDILRTSPGLSLQEDRSRGVFATPIDAEGKNDVIYGRIRQDISHSNALEMWVVGDQLLKGAALNAVQIAEHLISQ